MTLVCGCTTLWTRPVQLRITSRFRGKRGPLRLQDTETASKLALTPHQSAPVTSVYVKTAWVEKTPDWRTHTIPHLQVEESGPTKQLEMICWAADLTDDGSPLIENPLFSAPPPLLFPPEESGNHHQQNLLHYVNFLNYKIYLPWPSLNLEGEDY